MAISRSLKGLDAWLGMTPEEYYGDEDNGDQDEGEEMAQIEVQELRVEVSTLLPNTIILIEQTGHQSDYTMLVTDVRQIEFECTLVIGCRENGRNVKHIFGNGAKVRVVDVDF